MSTVIQINDPSVSNPAGNLAEDWHMYRTGLIRVTGAKLYVSQ